MSSRRLQRLLAKADPGETVLNFERCEVEHRTSGGRLLAVETGRGWLVPDRPINARPRPAARPRERRDGAGRKQSRAGPDSDPDLPSPRSGGRNGLTRALPRDRVDLIAWNCGHDRDTVLAVIDALTPYIRIVVTTSRGAR